MDKAKIWMFAPEKDKKQVDNCRGENWRHKVLWGKEVNTSILDYILDKE